MYLPDWLLYARAMRLVAAQAGPQQPRLAGTFAVQLRRILVVRRRSRRSNSSAERGSFSADKD